MSITAEQIKELREETGVSVMKCKSALEETNGDMEQARAILKEQGAKAAAKKADRELNAGIITSYVHANSQVGVLLKLSCETDYVAKNSDFIGLGDDIALHITAMMPASVEELMEQPFVKNPEITITKLLEEKTFKIGERMEVSDFTRYEV